MSYWNKYAYIKFYVLFLFILTNPIIKSKLPALHIVILGSSTAHGAGASSKDKSWVGLLNKYVKSIDKSFKVTNLAKSEITSFHILPTKMKVPDNRPNPDPSLNITKALSMNPSFIIVNLPSNDIIYNYPVLEQYINFLILMEEANIPIYFTTAQPRNSTEEIRKNLRQLASYIDNKLPSINFWSGLVTEENRIKEEYNSGDDIHLNDKGHQILFERVIESGIITKALLNLYKLQLL